MSQAGSNINLPQQRLKQYVSTRWNSSFYMVESILEQKMALAKYSTENGIAQLTPTQLDLLRE